MMPRKAPLKPSDQGKGHANRDPESFRGKYRLKRLIGLGGTGAVHEADDLETGKVVVVKVFHNDLSRDEAQAVRFTAAEYVRMLTEFLRALEWEQPPILVASGQSETSLLDQFKSHQRMTVLAKPYTIAQLNSALRSIGVLE